jgi:hypothetical protein
METFRIDFGGAGFGPLRVVYEGRIGLNAYLFRLLNYAGEIVPGEKVSFWTKDPGAKVTEPGSLAGSFAKGFSGSASDGASDGAFGALSQVSDSEGFLKIGLKLDGGVFLNGVKVLSLPHKNGREETHLLPLGEELTLRASRKKLTYQIPETVIFTVTDGGRPLPLGAVLNFYSDPKLLGGIPLRAAVDAEGGRIRVSGVVALKIGSLGTVRVSFPDGLKSSNEVAFMGEEEVVRPDALELIASESVLPFLSPKSLTLTPLFNGAALPEGTELILTYDSASLGGLSSKARVRRDGTIVFPESEALVPEGSIALSATYEGVASNTVYFLPEINPLLLLMTFALDPDLSITGGGSYEKGDVLPCKSYKATLSFSYNGKPLKGLPVTLEGMGLSIKGMETNTDEHGEIEAELFYDSSDYYYYLSNPDYLVSFAGNELIFPGANPQGFESCD